MKKIWGTPGILFCLLFLFPALTARAAVISGTGTWGSFQGSLTYTCVASPGEAGLEVQLTNTSAPGNGGYITGFALNNPGGRFTAVGYSDSVFDLLGSPVFNNVVNAMPLGYFDFGAALGGSWMGGGDPKPGIAVGETRTFSFTLTGIEVCGLSVMSLVNETASSGTDFFVVRFRGFENGESDKVPADEVIVPVTLSSFTAVGGEGPIEVRWTSQTEIDLLAYHLNRSQAESGPYVPIARLEAQGSTELAQDYRYMDTDVVAGRNYFYQLVDEDYLGNMGYHGPIAASAMTSVPGEYRLLPNYPNPFNASTAISYQMPVSAWVHLNIYDVLGRKVRILVDEHREAGGHTALWNGRDDRGQELRSGVYFCVFESGADSETIKMVLTR